MKSEFDESVPNLWKYKGILSLNFTLLVATQILLDTICTNVANVNTSVSTTPRCCRYLGNSWQLIVQFSNFEVGGFFGFRRLRWKKGCFDSPRSLISLAKILARTGKSFAETDRGLGCNEGESGGLGCRFLSSCCIINVKLQVLPG